MEITKELLDREIAQGQIRLDEGSASVNKLAGALSVLKDLRAFMDREVEIEAPKTDISLGNAEAQRRDEERARSMKEVAELMQDAEEEAILLEGEAH